MNPVNSKAKYLHFFPSNLNILCSTCLQTAGCVFSSRPLLSNLKQSLFVSCAFLLEKPNCSKTFWTNESIQIPFPVIVWLALDPCFHWGWLNFTLSIHPQSGKGNLVSVPSLHAHACSSAIPCRNTVLLALQSCTPTLPQYPPTLLSSAQQTEITSDKEQREEKGKKQNKMKSKHFNSLSKGRGQLLN